MREHETHPSDKLQVIHLMVTLRKAPARKATHVRCCYKYATSADFWTYLRTSFHGSWQSKLQEMLLRSIIYFAPVMNSDACGQHECSNSGLVDNWQSWWAV